MPCLLEVRLFLFDNSLLLNLLEKYHEISNHTLLQNVMIRPCQRSIASHLSKFGVLMQRVQALVLMFIFLSFSPEPATADFSFTPDQTIPAQGTTKMEYFEIGGQSYLAASNYFGGDPFIAQPKIYRNDAGTWTEIQVFPSGERIWDIEYFSIGADHYLSFANFINDLSGYTCSSFIYKWDGSSFVLFQSLPLNAASTDTDFFTIASDSYLSFTKHYNSVGTGILDSHIYKWNGVSFELYQAIPTKRARDIEVFTYAGEQYLAIGNYYNDLNGSYNLDSPVYKWDIATSQFEFQLNIATAGVKSIKSYEIDGSTYLAVANFFNGSSYETDSHLYKFEGTTISLEQSILTHGIEHWEFFELHGVPYLAEAQNGHDDIYSTTNTVLHRWDGSSFAFSQSFNIGAGSISTTYFEMNGTPYLAKPSYYDGVSFTIVPSQIYRLDGPALDIMTGPISMSPSSSESLTFQLIDANGQLASGYADSIDVAFGRDLLTNCGVTENPDSSYTICLQGNYVAGSGGITVSSSIDGVSVEDYVSVNLQNTEGAEITAVDDVPNDQGKQIRLEWLRSNVDFSGSSTPILQYVIYREYDAELANQIPDNSEALATFKETGLDKALLALPGWDFVTTVPAFGQNWYSVNVATLADSTASNGGYVSRFYVRAATASPGTYFDSLPGSGQSIDNLSPAVPLALNANYQASGTDLNWADAPEADFQFYRVYRGTDPNFVASPSSLVQEIAVSNWTDTTANPWMYSYKVSAVDFAGNESAAAVHVSVSDVPVITTSSFALHNAAPNPFNPSTTLSFTVGGKEQVSLRVYDISGRLVTTLVNGEMSGGAHSVIWDGRDSSGETVASGIYLYQIQSHSFTQTKRMTLLK